MKKNILYTCISLLGLSLLAISCGPSKVYATREKNPEPVYNDPVPARYSGHSTLIIQPRPGFRMNQTHDGRFFHRNHQGLIYWKGIDNRFYLDKNYLKRVYYTKWEYREWKRYRRQNR